MRCMSNVNSESDCRAFKFWLHFLLCFGIDSTGKTTYYLPQKRNSEDETHTEPYFASTDARASRTHPRISIGYTTPAL